MQRTQRGPGSWVPVKHSPAKVQQNGGDYAAFVKFHGKNAYLWWITACQRNVIDVKDTSPPPLTGKGNIKTVQMKM